MGSTKSEERLAPIFILADDDKGALDRILERLHNEWFYIPVANPSVVLKYAKRIDVKAIFLADPVNYPRGGAAFLLQRLIDEVGKPVIVLAEEWTSEIADKWKRMGAEDCLPHPTRFNERMELLRSKMQSLALAAGPRQGNAGTHAKGAP
jgi:FixJ family two-component response regulator